MIFTLIKSKEAWEGSSIAGLIKPYIYICLHENPPAKDLTTCFQGQKRNFSF